MTEFTIEKNIPMPAGRTGRPNTYPFAQMEIGDSFAITAGEGLANKARNNVSNCSIKWAKANAPECKFSTRVIDNTVRIWRVA